MILTYEQAIDFMALFPVRAFSVPDPDDDEVEGDWSDEEDEDFEDNVSATDDLHEIQVDDDLWEPNAEDDDHLPDDDLQ